MAAKQTVHVVAEASGTRAELARAAFSLGHHAEIYAGYDELLQTGPSHGIILAEDITNQGGASTLLDGMAVNGFWCPVIAVASDVDVPRIVAAVRAGALDYLAPTLEAESLQCALDRAASFDQSAGTSQREAVQARAKLTELTTRELEVLDFLVAGSSNKEIARALEISPRTVEIHRANMMVKLGAKHPADAIRCWLAAKAG